MHLSPTSKLGYLSFKCCYDIGFVNQGQTQNVDGLHHLVIDSSATGARGRNKSAYQS